MYFAIIKMLQKRCKCVPWSHRIEDWITDEWNDMCDRRVVFMPENPNSLSHIPQFDAEFVRVEPHAVNKYFQVCGLPEIMRTDEEIVKLQYNHWFRERVWYFQLSRDHNIFKKFTCSSFIAEKNGFVDNEVSRILLLTIYEHHQEKVKYGKKQIKPIEQIIFDCFLMKGIMRY